MMKTYLINYRFRLLLAIACLFASCNEDKPCPEPITREVAVSKTFKMVSASNNFIVTIRPGKIYILKATGCGNDLDDMECTVKDGVLDIRFTKHRSRRYLVEFDITTPQGAEVQFFKTPRVRTERKTDTCQKTDTCHL